MEFGAGIDIVTHGRVIGFARALSAAQEGGGLLGVIEWVPTFRSVTVFFDPLARNITSSSKRGSPWNGEGRPICRRIYWGAVCTA